jgi:hypothetical protein
MLPIASVPPMDAVDLPELTPYGEKCFRVWKLVTKTSEMSVAIAQFAAAP